MPDELGTHDVLEQLDARLESIEQNHRAHEIHMESRFDSIEQNYRALVASIESRFERVERRFDDLRSEMSANNRWLLGVMLGSWISLIASFWLKP